MHSIFLTTNRSDCANAINPKMGARRLAEGVKNQKTLSERRRGRETETRIAGRMAAPPSTIDGDTNLITNQNVTANTGTAIETASIETKIGTRTEIETETATATDTGLVTVSANMIGSVKNLSATGAMMNTMTVRNAVVTVGVYHAAEGVKARG